MPDYSEAKPMLLSEAIRLGATLNAQTFEKLHDKKTLGTCAIGAALEALGQNGAKMKELYPWLFWPEYAYCPQCGRKFPNPVRVITHLNDRHRLSRSAIADFVKAIEANLGLQDSEALSKQTDTQGITLPLVGLAPEDLF
jgi:hypothetical protein